MNFKVINFDGSILIKYQDMADRTQILDLTGLPHYSTTALMMMRDSSADSKSHMAIDILAQQIKEAVEAL